MFLCIVLITEYFTEFFSSCQDIINQYTSAIRSVEWNFKNLRLREMTSLYGHRVFSFAKEKREHENRKIPLVTR